MNIKTYRWTILKSFNGSEAKKNIDNSIIDKKRRKKNKNWQEKKRKNLETIKQTAKHYKVMIKIYNFKILVKTYIGSYTSHYEQPNKPNKCQKSKT